MPTDTVTVKLSEQALLDAVNESIAKLQEACTQFSNVMLALTTHEADEAAHPDIRDLIQDVVSGTGFLLKTEATPIINGIVGAHNTDAAAHPSLLTTINNIVVAANALKARVDVLAPEDPTDPETELARRLKEIDDQFDPVLLGLMQAWTASQINHTGNSDQIAAEYQATTALKAVAITAVMQEFNYA